MCTVKPVYNDHPRDPKIVAVVDRWSLFRGQLLNKSPNWNLKIVVVSKGKGAMKEKKVEWKT
jgi:hypothetical protein